MMNNAEHVLGDLTLKAPFARATLPNQPVAGAFLTITNNGTEDDVRVGVRGLVDGPNGTRRVKFMQRHPSGRFFLAASMFGRCHKLVR